MANAAGDFTGRKKQELAAKYAEEQERRASEMAMASASAEKTKSREVVDYTQPKAASPPPDTGPVDLTEDTSDDPTIDAIVAATREDEGDDDGPTPEELDAAQEATARQQVQAVDPTQVQKTSVLIRARYDLEQVTIGHGNHYDFEEGRKYRVPPNVANHLSERGLVDVLG